MNSANRFSPLETLVKLAEQPIRIGSLAKRLREERSVLSKFGELVEEHLRVCGFDLGELSELLLDAGADDYDAHPGVLAATLTAAPSDTFAIGWCPRTWTALGKVLGNPPRERMLPLLKAFYFVGPDEEPAA
jgi:hypothetical protein